MKQSIETLLEHNAVLNSIYNNSAHNAILIMDANGYILHYNEAFSHTYGYKLPELLNVHTRVLFTEADQRSMMPEIEVERVKEHGCAMDRNYLMHKEGKCIWVSGESVLTKDESGAIYIFKIIQNIHEQKLLEKFLRQSQEFAEDVVASIQDGVMVMDMESRILKVNQWICKEFGFNHLDVEKKTLSELGSPMFTSSQLLQAIEEVKTYNSCVVLQLRFHSPGNQECIYTVKASMLGGAGSTERILIVVSDVAAEVTARQTAEARAEALHQVVASMPQKVWTVDGTKTNFFYNDSWISYTGQSQEALAQGGWRNAIHPEDWQKNKQVWQEAITSGSPYTFEHRLQSSDGYYRWHLWRGIPQRSGDDQLLAWINTDTDIHNQKMHEALLEQKVKNRTAELRSSYEKLKQSSRELEQFATIAAHDLQEPLRKALVYCDMLDSKFEKEVPPVLATNIQKIQVLTRQASAMIKDVVDYSSLHLTSNKHQYTVVNLTDVLQQVMLELQPDIEQTDTIIDAGELPIIEGISAQLYQLFYNIIGNSIRYCHPSRAPHISIGSSVPGQAEVAENNLCKEKTYVKLSFKDNGIGFDAAFSERMFLFFKRAQGTQQAAGRGMGLAISRKIVHNHNGEIKAIGTPGTGACIVVYLPLQHRHFEP